MSQALMVELHPKDCTCRGALWMMPEGSPKACEGEGGAPSNAVVISAEQWRSLGKPRTIESHDVAAQRAAAASRRSASRS